MSIFPAARCAVHRASSRVPGEALGDEVTKRRGAHMDSTYYLHTNLAHTKLVGTYVPIYLSTWARMGIGLHLGICTPQPVGSS